MSMCAIVSVANMDAANKALETAGFGTPNFSVAAYTGLSITHAGLHTRGDPAFEDAVRAITGVVVDVIEGEPATRFQALVEAQGAKWGDRATDLPSKGIVEVGLYWHNDDLVYVEKRIDRTEFAGDPKSMPETFKDVTKLPVRVAVTGAK